MRRVAMIIPGQVSEEKLIKKNSQIQEDKKLSEGYLSGVSKFFTFFLILY
jgi:hypothetical protein